jgi:dUTP pyrophosphatase
MNTKINVVKLDSAKSLNLPSYATENSAGVDLVAAIENKIIIKPHQRALISTGICIELPSGFEATVRPRSGIAAKNGVTVLNTPGTIDSDYRGEIKVILINLGNEDFVVERGMRIAQMIFSRYEKVSFSEVANFDSTTTRGEGGFGSTGVK